MKLRKKCRLVMIGDSVTDCGRNYDAAPAGWGSFGNGYVSLIDSMLTAFAPSEQIMVINRGVNGNTVLDLKERWQRDVLDLRPDAVCVMIGVNDVWRQFDSVVRQEPIVTPEEFQHTYEELILATLPQVDAIYLMGCFMVEPNVNDPMGSMVRRYAALTKELAVKYGLTYIDVQSRLDEYTRHLSAYYLSSDRVHPNGSCGHLLLAKAFLDAVGFTWN